MIFRREFPLYLQYDAMDCGPACLRMVAAHYGKKVSLQYLRDKSFASREGVSLQGLHDAAAAVGMQARCVLASLAYLAEEAGLPCIVHWERDHFVVLYRVKHDCFYIADPACGRQRLNAREFAARWAEKGDEGYALLLEPAADFARPLAAEPSTAGVGRLLSYLRPYRRRLAQLLLALLLGSGIQLLLPLLTQQIVDRGIMPGDVGLLRLILLGQFVLIVSRALVDFLRSWILFHIGTPLNIALVRDFLAKLTRLPLRYFDVKMLGDTLQRIGDHQRVEVFLSHSLLGFLLTGVNLVVFSLVLAAYDGVIFSLFVAGTVLYLLWIRAFLPGRREIDFIRFRQLGRNHNAIIQLIMGMQDIRLNNCEQGKLTTWRKLQAELFATGKRSLALTQKQETGCLLIREMQNLVITYVAAVAVIDGGITLGMMLAIQFILGQLTGPVEQLVHFAATAQDAKISYERIAEVQNLPDEEADPAAKTGRLATESDIVLDAVSFQYQGPYSARVLNDISLRIPCRKTTAIVGASGSGKTTLLKLLLGVYRPTKGQIRIGASPLTDIPAAEWRRVCGCVLQDGYLFSDTIANNIALSDGPADEGRVREASVAANIDDFIGSLPLGYRTVIGADGQGLSQGQKQRILIARAVYKNPAWLFLDEATNSLDAGNEAAILHRLAPFFQKRTVVVVAHRLSTVKNADHIIVLDRGTVVEIGAHAELIARRGAYFRLVEHQLELGV